MNQPLACIVGHQSRAEFSAPLHCIETILASESWNISTFSQIPRSLSESRLIVLMQSYPGEFSDRHFFSIKTQIPLAPVILIAGTCTEGELRTGRPLPGCFRLYAYQWSVFYAKELSNLLQGSRSVFALPLTYESEEVILEENRFFGKNRQCAQNDKNSCDKSCYIVFRQGPFGNDSAMNRLLAEQCRKKYQTVILDRKKIDKSFCGNILVDVDDSSFYEILKAVQSLRADFADAEIKLYINSPRINEKNALQEAGANVILAKPVCW